MPELQNPSVVIVGAGPTGLTAGNLLGMVGIDTIIFERNAGLSDCPKAIAFDDEGLRICQAMGLSDAVLKDVLLDIDAHYISAGHFLAKVAPTSKRNGYPLISTFHQPTFEGTLLQGLQRFKCVSVHFQHTVETFEQNDSYVVVSVRMPDGTLLKIECAYLLACDGGKSSIRRTLNIPMQGSTFAQKWLVIDSIADQKPSTVVTFFCNPKRPAVTIPAPHQGKRWEFMLLPGEQEEDLLQEEKIHALIAEVGGPIHPQIIRQAIYTFHAALARSFSKGRVFLLGDAAHMMPPFGGQAMNSGLRDAHNLCWKLQLVLQGLASPQLLDTYHEERYRHVAQMIRFSSFLGSIVMTKSPLIALFRDIVFRTMNRIPPTRKFLSEVGPKPHPHYKKGFMLSNGRSNRENKAMAGGMLPQPEVMTSQGKRVLLDDVLGTGFAILRLHNDPAKAFAPLIPQSDFWERLHTRFICVRPGTKPIKFRRGEGGREGWGGPLLDAVCGTVWPAAEIASMVSLRSSVDSLPMGISPIVIQSNEFTDFLQNGHDIFVLVRPDRYIYGVFKEENADAFISSLRGNLAPYSEIEPNSREIGRHHLC